MTQALDDYLMDLADQISTALEALETSMNRFDAISEEQTGYDDTPVVQLRQKRRRRCKQKKKGDQSIPEKVVAPNTELPRVRIASQEALVQQSPTTQPFHLRCEDFPPL